MRGEERDEEEKAHGEKIGACGWCANGVKSRALEVVRAKPC